MNENIAVLMSTYNGERYLDDQIMSIINQSNQNWHLYVRDDGSSDGTQAMLAKFAAKYEKITFINENNVTNIGVNRSFMSLLHDIEADYYMFSDQDDVWNKNKIELTLNKMKQSQTGHKPILVFTDLDVVDVNLNSEGVMNGTNIWTSFLHLLFTNCVTGCTVMVNEDLKRMIDFDSLNYENIYMHDWWVALIASAFGEAVYLNKATIKYRQHGDNVVGSNEKNTIMHLLHRVTHLKPETDHVRLIAKIAHEFQRRYPNKLTGRNLKFLNAYADLYYKSSFWHNLKLVMRFHPQRMNLKGRIFYSYLLVVFNKKFLIERK